MLPPLYSRYESVKITWQYLHGKALSLSALMILGHYVSAETMLSALHYLDGTIDFIDHCLAIPVTSPANGRMQSHGEKITTRPNDHILVALSRGT